MRNAVNEVVFERDDKGSWHFKAKDKFEIELNIIISEVCDGWGYHVVYDGLDEYDERYTEEVCNDKTINGASCDLVAGGLTKNNIVKVVKQKLRYIDGKHSYSIVSQVANAPWKFPSND